MLPFIAMGVVSLTAAGGRLHPGRTTRSSSTNPTYRQAMVNSLEVTVIVTVVSVAAAYPFAWILAEQVPERWQRLALMLAVLPFWTSYVVRSYSWLLVLAENGVVNRSMIGLGIISEPVQLANTRLATVIGFVHFFVMLLTLTIFANLKQLGPSYRKAAADLGAGALSIFLHVTLPLTLPGMMVGRVPDLRAGDRRLHHAADSRRQQRAPDAAAHHDADRPPRGLSVGFGSVARADGGRDNRLSRLRALAEDRAGLTMARCSRLSRSPMLSLVYGFIFLPVLVLVLFSLQATVVSHPALHRTVAEMVRGRSVRRRG